MKKKVGTTIYNTETADLLSSRSHGEFGDSSGYEEQLYKTKKGKLFVYGIGGPDSKYANEDIWVISEDDAKTQFGVS